MITLGDVGFGSAFQNTYTHVIMTCSHLCIPIYPWLLIAFSIIPIPKVFFVHLCRLFITYFQHMHLFTLQSASFIASCSITIMRIRVHVCRVCAEQTLTSKEDTEKLSLQGEWSFPL